MGLLVHNPGVSTTVQDLGRAGYRQWGVPPGGAFDRGAAALANALLGNPAGCAVLELTLVGGVYEAQTPLALALAGAPMAAAIERAGQPARALEVPQSFSLGAGERLVLGGAPVGARTYLAVRGGWQTPLLLGSRSREARLKAGTLLCAEPSQVPARRPAEALWDPPGASPLGIIAGPDAGLAPALDKWATAVFHVGRHADRMGLRLEGPSLTVDSPPQRISAPVAPGAVQIAGGQAIVLGVACGTMGGYPHVAHVISADLDRVGQLRPGDSVRFRSVSLSEAWRLDRAARQARLDRLRRLQAVAASG